MSTTPQRKLTLADAVFIGAGSMIGAGLFAVFAPAARAAGDYLLISLAIAAFLAFANATSSAQLAAQYPQSGGTYIYGKKQLGDIWGFLAGWCFVVGKTASCAAMAMTFAAYAAPSWQKPLAIGAVLALTAVNYRGITRTATLTKLLVTLVLAGLAVFFVAVLIGTSPAPLYAVDSGTVGLYGVLQGAGLLFFAFAGYARIATMGGEVIQPERTIPRAILWALSLVGLLYLAVALVVLSQFSPAQLAGSVAPLADAVGSWPFARGALSLAASLAALGALLALITGIGRTGHAMAVGKHLPAVFAPLHPRFGVPHRLEITVALAVCLLILLFDVREAIGFSSFGILLYYFLANCAALTQGPAHRRYPRWLQVAGASGCFIVVWTLPLASITGGLVLLICGLLYYLLFARRQAQGSSDSR